MTLRLLAVHAHPDDESSKGAATTAAYRARGVEVMVVSLTGGERGEVLNPGLTRMAMAERDLPGLRRLEMADAAAALDVQHRWLGYYDSGMPSEDGSLPVNSFASIPVEISAEALVRVIREFRPHVMTTYDENGGYPHPDHIRCHVISMFAFEAAASRDAYPDAGEPWQVSKVYYDQIFNYPRTKANADMLLAESPDSPLAEQLAEMLTWVEGRPDRATAHVPVGDFLEKRDDALRAHECQVAPDSRFFFWSNDLQRRAWPFEDFELARSVVPVREREDDLFEGIEDTE
ncbi:mycothiol conjugate amidase Mca [Labedella populi]|uniref:Mycothiol S-conjugate amidase n=1 Tax=Labedella populi TaxID=2498850 RepID=A0A444QDA2_9MICO|nr:mycothiol conjugate amidase Mca [Labedella populi]RWZ64660.1 mycothiol conjugate amidase Mca [Labedella populi]